MRDTLQTLDDEFAFQTSGRFDLLAGEHVAYTTLGAPDVDGALRRSIERAEGVTTVVGRMGSGKSSLIAAVADSLEEGFLPLRVSVIGVEAGDPAAFARHAITEIRDLPETQLTRHEAHALDRAAAEHRTQIATRELRAGFEIAAGQIWRTRGEMIDSRKDGIGRAVHVDRISRQRCLAARHGHRLDLVEQHDALHAVFDQAREIFLKQLAHQLLTLTVLGAHKPMGRHLDQSRPLAAEHT
jgi:hypothetical protein